MKITVILCTYNRCQHLAKALESAAALRLPELDEWEVVVVDNNSSDQTRQVVQEFCQQYPHRFHYVFETQQGKSYALNAGIREGRGDVLAFMDDDVTVQPTWLQNLTASLHNADWAGAGGRILLQRTFTPPPWLSLKERYALGPLVHFDLGPEAGDLTEAPIGTNMAFRREMFEKYGGFRTDLGPRPGSEIRSEDSEFSQRLLAAGERLRYEPSAVVYHAIPECRLRKRYFLDWWFDKARADVRAFGSPVDTNWRVAGIPLVLFRRLARWTLCWMVAVEPSRRFSCKLKVRVIVGQIIESYRQQQRAETLEGAGGRPAVETFWTKCEKRSPAVPVTMGVESQGPIQVNEAADASADFRAQDEY
jgi:glycosyltransferase involved in cell wall biosynthesis